MSQNDIVMLVGGIAAVILAGVDIVRTSGQSLTAWAAAVLGVVFVILAIT